MFVSFVTPTMYLFTIGSADSANGISNDSSVPVLFSMIPTPAGTLSTLLMVAEDSLRPDTT